MPPKKNSKISENKNIKNSFKSVKWTGGFKDIGPKAKKAVDLQKIQEILKEFDLNADYGPIIGIPRTARYIRALNFNLSIKEEVTEILTDQELLEDYPEINLNIWHDIETLL